MSESRTKNSIKNAGYGIFLQAIGILTNYVTRIILVRTLGIAVNGLNGLFTEVISMISLAELGVGTAIIYNLYKPLAENDIPKLTQLMTLFRKAYRIIAGAIMAVGLALTPVVHLLVTKTDFSVGYIRLVFVLFVAQTASSYLFSYKSSLLNADQKVYIVSTVTAIFKVIMAVVNIAVLLLTKSFVAFLITRIAVTLGMNMTISIVANRKYPFLKNSSQLPREERRSILSNVKHLFISSLSGKITNSTDNTLISILVSTVVVGVYSNYALILNSVNSVCSQVMNSLSGSVGNLMVTESPEKSHSVLKKLSFLFFFAGSLCGVGFYCVATPFVALCFGRENILAQSVLLVSAANFFLYIAREPLWKMLQVSGLFAKDKNISILGSTVNLIVSLVLGKLIGIAGIFIGTVCTHVIQIILKILLLYRDRFHISPREYLLYWLKIVVLLTLELAAGQLIYILVAFESLVATFLVRGVLALITVVAATALCYRRTPEWCYYWKTARGMIRFPKKRS